MHSEPCQTSKMEILVETFSDSKLSTIFEKRSTLDIWQGSEYLSAGALENVCFSVFLNTHGKKLACSSIECSCILIHGYGKKLVVEWMFEVVSSNKVVIKIYQIITKLCQNLSYISYYLKRKNH